MNKKILVSIMIFGIMVVTSILPNVIADESNKEITITMEYFGPPEDINHDGQIDVYDISILVTNYGKTGDPGWIRADITRSGQIDVYDISRLINRYSLIWIVIL